MVQAIDIYYRLRDEVDHQVIALSKQHGDWIHCRKGCSSCCLDLTVWPVEYYAILNEMKVTNWPKPEQDDPRACGFLDANGACRMYPFRPIICRTHGLPLAYFQEDNDPPGYGISFCEKNFETAHEIRFDSENTLNMDDINEKLARINIVFLEENPDLHLQPTDRIELRQLLDAQ